MTSIKTNNETFVVAPTALADVRVEFTIGSTRFNLACQLVETLAPTHEVYLEYPGGENEPNAFGLYTRSLAPPIRGLVVGDTWQQEADLWPSLSYRLGNRGDSISGTFHARWLQSTSRTPQDTHEVNFAVINLNGLDKVGHQVDGSKVWPQIGGAILQDEAWTVQIRQSPNSGEAKKYLRTIGGFQITHIGSMYRTDGLAFSQDEAESEITALRTFLSFTNGAWIGINRVFGTDQKHQIIWHQWDAGPADWSRGTPGYSWLYGDVRIFDVPAAMAEAYKQLMKEIRDGAGGDIGFTIERYLSANSLWPYIDGVVGRAMGDIAARKWAQSTNSPWEILASELIAAGVDADIPAECPNLQWLYDQNSDWSKNDRASGPSVLDHLRNSFEHPKKPVNGQRTAYWENALYEAWHLSQWYLETLILYKNGYKGVRFNRVKDGALET